MHRCVTNCFLLARLFYRISRWKCIFIGVLFILFTKIFDFTKKISLLPKIFITNWTFDWRVAPVDVRRAIEGIGVCAWFRGKIELKTIAKRKISIDWRSFCVFLLRSRLNGWITRCIDRCSTCLTCWTGRIRRWKRKYFNDEKSNLLRSVIWRWWRLCRSSNGLLLLLLCWWTWCCWTGWS